MKNIFLFSLLVIIGIFFCKISFAQNIFPSTGSAGIGTTTPNASSILEVKSTTQGVLISRMTKSQRDAIASPAQGLLVYVTDKSPGIYYYENSWKSLKGANKALDNLTAPTAVNVDLLPGSNDVTNLGSSSFQWKMLYLDSAIYLGGNKFITYHPGSGVENTAVGSAVLNANTSGSDNSGFGFNALWSNTTGYDNTAIGRNALYNNIGGYDNCALGNAALYSNATGYENTATGRHALYSNTTGFDNTAVGMGALYSNDAGFQNTAVGVQALYNSNSGTDNDNNTAVGFQALYSTITGSQNTATGAVSLYYNTSGSYNVADGLFALQYNTSGSYNTASGEYALPSNTTGSSNTGLGYDADVSSNNLSNATVIGYGAIVNASNKVRIGNTSVSSNGGQVSWTSYSDGRIKNDVKENVPGLQFINQLRPVTFHYDVKKENELLGVKDTANWKDKYDIEKIQFTGFIAQEVEAAANKINYDFSGVDKSGNVMGLRYSDFVVPLVKSVQELDSMNNSLQSTVSSLSKGLLVEQKENTEMKSQIAQLQSSIVSQQSSTTNGFAKLSTSNLQPATLLGQNIPNPFDNSTLIPFRIPKDCKDASIMITNTSTSEVISVIPISCNEDHVSIDAGTLTSGTYSYTLYVDRKMIDTKEMVLTK